MNFHGNEIAIGWKRYVCVCASSRFIIYELAVWRKQRYALHAGVNHLA